MKTKRFFIPCLVLLMLAACQPVELEIPDSPLKPDNGTQSANSVWTLTVQAEKAVDTKALELIVAEDELDAYWVEGEKVSVYLGGDYKGYLTATPKSAKSKTATLSGTFESVDGFVENQTTLTLLFPGREDKLWDYSEQTGTISTISSNYAYATATATVKSINTNDGTITTTGASFTNEQSIYRFQFKLDENTAVTVKDFMLWSSDKKALVQKRELVNNEWTSTQGFLCVKPGSDTNEPLYVSIRNEMDKPTKTQIQNRDSVDAYRFVITGSSHELYLATKGIPAHVLDAPGKFISATTIVASQPDFSPAEGIISSTTEVF